MPKLLVIGYVWPEPASSAAGLRMMQLLEFFKNNGFQVVFATTARETENKIDLHSHIIDTLRIKLNDPEFDDHLKELMPDVVLFDRFMMEEQFGWRVDDICPDALKILDTEDLHFLRQARREAYHKNLDEEAVYFDSELAKREISAIYRCDLSLIISETEMELLISKFQLPENILFYLPFLLNNISKKDILKLPDFEDRKDFICIGNFLHEPNWNAVQHLKKELWPKIRRILPEACMQIYGAYASPKVRELHDPGSGFFINGWAEDSALVMQNARVCLGPVQFGAGLKGKFIEAMQNGTPSVTTLIGAEGINGNLPWPGFITNSDKEFIQKAVELYSNKDTWNKKQALAIEIINSRFNKTEHEKRFSEKLYEIQKNLKQVRKKNFTGKMLKHHLHRSTYFMSRFIEEKNRNKN